jgi:transaldolase/glucose-6-phosphate isomerase
VSNPLTELVALGQSPWIDFIRRSFMSDGSFGKLIAAGEIRGATSNPTIFEKAIGGSSDYDDQLKTLVRQGVTDPKKIFDELSIADIQQAADILRPVYEQTSGADGFISLEVSPGAAHDAATTLQEARYLWGRVGRPNVMIKVPATSEGVPAVEQLLSEGINVNITLMFAVPVYEDVAHAYIKGLQKRAAAGQPVDRIASVASFFVSRVDTETDKRLNKLLESATDDAQKQRITALLGKAAIANAKLAYERFQAIFGGQEFRDLAAKGAHVQRPLWASTSTKNPAYRDVIYVEQLIGPDTVNTMPPATIDAFRDHGQAHTTITQDVASAHHVMAELAALGINIDDVTQTLIVEGVKSFSDSYDQLMEETAKKVGELQQQVGGASHPTKASGAPTRDGDILALLAGATGAALQRLQTANALSRLWERDTTLWQNDATTPNASRLGWVDLPRVMEAEVRDLNEFANAIRMADYVHILLVGADEASRCAALLGAVFGPQPGWPTLTVLDTTYPDALARIERELDLRRTLVVVADQTGNTLATVATFTALVNTMRARLGDQAVARNVIAITDPGSALDGAAFPFRRVFRNPPDMDGRFAALSYFGLVPAALLGSDIDALLDAALAMQAECGALAPLAHNPGAMLGARLAAEAQAGRDKLTLVASPSVAAFVPWIAQLVGNSLGRGGRGIVPVVEEPPGAPDAYGQDRLFVYLRADEGADAAQDAALAALEAAGQPVVRLRLRSRYAVAGECVRWQVAVALAAHLLGGTPFGPTPTGALDVATRRILESGERARRLPAPMPLLTEGGITLAASNTAAEALRGTTNPAGIKDALLRMAKPGDFVAILAYLAPAPENDALIARLRAWLRDHGHLATVADIGPREQHTLAPLLLRGPATGIILQLVAMPEATYPLDGTYTPGTLFIAQSLATYDALQAQGRRIVRITFGSDPRATLATLVD